MSERRLRIVHGPDTDLLVDGYIGPGLRVEMSCFGTTNVMVLGAWEVVHLADLLAEHIETWRGIAGAYDRWARAHPAPVASS